ncbi:hypothetical protein [Plasmodium yoelii yoelii]|uniref:Uncharacterized protein n=1 Tax=Plasmodium yoelii yoelii TaxID=73239 RepID=Q7RNW1_PLAYO|nr:hypothetical protein [Plasmodium yoelii yoelii]
MVTTAMDTSQISDDKIIIIFL